MNPKSLLNNLLLLVVLGVLTVAALVVFNRAAAPQQRPLPTEGGSMPDYPALLQAVSQETLKRDLETLQGFGNRFAGTAGCEKTADWLVGTFKDLGYTVTEQPFPVVVPVTQYARLLGADGKPVEGVSIYPLLPNVYRTCTTPPEGLKGTVYEGKLGLAREFRTVSINGNFALLPIATDWSTLAGMGVKAVLYFKDKDKTDAPRWTHSVNASLDIPRFLVQGDLDKIRGQAVTIQARVDYEQRTARNLVAVLPVTSGDKDALILNGYYDSYSYAPDLAPGATQGSHLATLLGCARILAGGKAEQRRNVMFLLTGAHCQAQAGMREFLTAIGTTKTRNLVLDKTVERAETAAAALKTLEEAKSIIADRAYWDIATADAEEAFWKAHSRDVRQAFTDTVVRVFDHEHMATYETLNTARVNWIRDGMPVKGKDGVEPPTFAANAAARQDQQLAQARLSMPLPKLKADAAVSRMFADAAFMARITQEAEKRLAQARLADRRAQARLALAKLLQDYERMLFLTVDVTPASQRLGLVYGGDNRFGAVCSPADSEVATQFQYAAAGLTKADTAVGTDYAKTPTGDERFVNLLRRSDTGGLSFLPGGDAGASAYYDSYGFFSAGFTGLAISNLGDGHLLFGTPSDTFDSIFNPPPPTPGAAKPTLPMENLELTSRMIAAATAQFARGHGQFLAVASQPLVYSFKGRVVSQVGTNLTPNQLMPGAIVHMYPSESWVSSTQPAGVSREFYAMADWDSEFEFGGVWLRQVGSIWTKKVTMDAAITRPETGDITWMLSSVRSAPRTPYAVQAVDLTQLERSLASAVIFRCTPVQVFPMPDPNTMNAYANFNLMEAGSLAAPKDQYMQSAGGGHVCFVPPDSRLFFTFKQGSKSNPNLMEVRAFALNAAGDLDKGEFRPGGIAGQGYFVADTPSLINIELDVARSMAQLNAARVSIQRKYNMADKMVTTYSATSIELANEASAKAAAGNLVEAKRKAAESMAYSANAHPVIRKNASDAIVGILFYLILAIPFSIFLEKLLVGHPDLRAQLLGQGVLFVLFFLALRAFHPAYQLVRSSYMILLGFVTFALAMAVGSFVAARFAKNMGELQRRFRQEVETSDVSRAGAASTAYLLGLNNLRKRPVRTALTMVTLILVTFVMICFASISTNVKDIEFPVGKAAYNGMLLRDRMLKDVAAALAPVRELYGEDHVVAPRSWAGNFVPIVGQSTEYAEYIITRTAGDKTYEVKANAILGVTVQEAEITDLKSTFDILTRWFEKDDEKSCFLPRTLADGVLLTDDDVKAGTAVVAMGGKDYTVLGIYDDGKVDAVLDLDGDSLMPIDLLSLRSPAVYSAGEVSSSQGEDEIPQNTPRLSARKVVITPRENMPAGAARMPSIAIKLKNLDYGAARTLIGSHLERTGQPAYYGLDGIAFFGGKFRMSSVEGLLDLVLPLIIAALTVLNTMRGSVYERRSELFVFNAVGLAPNHIRFLFLAEASVYAVVGVVGGYLLAQSSGTMLKLIGLAGGLTINYSSLSAVAVSVVIMLVVFLSSLIPARMAARIAAPSETMTLKRRVATSDEETLELPFTFNKRDRIGIIPYFADWLGNYGEGSAGEFFCSPPVATVTLDAAGHPMPCLTTTTWLKPYDLGVSQKVDVIVRLDSKTGDNVAVVVMTRLSGDRDSWDRCRHAFIRLLRKRFLTWRAVSDDDRKLLLERGRKLLDPNAAA